MEDIDYIPIESAMCDFNFHLKSHSRTIFSSGFGEGKSFFLNKFKSQYNDIVFITLYPVNYQVASNQDIFELIKRDVLFQLFLNGILKPTQHISNSVALSFFIANPQNYVTWIIDAISAIDYPAELANKAIKLSIRFFRKANSIFQAYCYKLNVTDNSCIELWNKIEAKGIYENDVITHLICDAIKNWKLKNPSKRICLLVEDLDRIDPAHLFRILNILSAHIDYSYKFGIQPSDEFMDGNKFGFDNIVCVLDFMNAVSIFRHFYGEATSWEGYISKFSSKGVFNFSLKEQKSKYFFSRAANICGVDESLLRQILSNDIIITKSMRKLNDALYDIESQIINPPLYSKQGIVKEYPQNLLYMFCLLRRMGIEDSEIISYTLKAINTDDAIKGFVYPYIFLKNDMNISAITFGEKQNNYLVQYDFSQDTSSNFKYTKSLLGSWSSNERYPSKEELIKFILSFVGQ